MSAYQPIALGQRELVEIDALIRVLTRLRHWSATATARRGHRDDRGRRLYVVAADLRDQAWADSLRAAHNLFEIDALHYAWLVADGRGS